jgi:hypothetical protein
MTSSQYYQDDLVWAKVKGCSWWPAVISSVGKSRNNGEPQVTVNFVGHNSHAILPLDKIVNYRDRYSEFSKTKKRSLLDAIEIANRIEAGTTTYIDEEEKLLKKNKFKKANEKKSIGSKKRKAPEKQRFSDNLANNIRLNPKVNSSKETPSNGSERNSSSGRIEFRLKQKQVFLKKLLNQNAKTVVTKKAKIEETLNEILSEALTVNQLQSSRLGQDLQQFANICSKSRALIEFQKTTQTVLNKLKEDVILSLFGAAETEKMQDNNKLHESLPKEEIKSPSNDQPSHKLRAVKEVKKEEEKVEDLVMVKTRTPERRSESSESFLANAKEPAIMLIVCKEIAELLKKVI